MNRTCEKCIHYEVCRYPLEYRAFPDTCWKYEEERPHGEWIFKNGKYRCTACGEKAIYKYNGMSTIPEAIITDFCPNCGADMRKEGEAE